MKNSWEVIRDKAKELGLEVSTWSGKDSGGEWHFEIGFKKSNPNYGIDAIYHCIGENKALAWLEGFNMGMEQVANRIIGTCKKAAGK